MSVGPPITFDQARLAARQVRSQHAFYRALAGGSHGARLLRLPGVEALAVPACPWLSFVNCVFFYESADALGEAIPQLQREYARAGVTAWRVWVPAYDAAAGATLRAAGFVLSAVLLRQAATLIGQDLEPRQALDLVPAPTWEMVARCNDRAYAAPESASMSAAFATMRDPASHLYAATLDGLVVASVLGREESGHCHLNLVATVPEARGKGIGTELVRLAKRAAVARGCQTSSGETTPRAEGLYARLGAHTLSPLQAWGPERASGGYR